jgi:hypothetical protein
MGDENNGFSIGGMGLLVFSCSYTPELTSSALHLLMLCVSGLYEAKSSSLVVSHSPLSAESYVATDGQSTSLSWNKAPLWGLRLDFYHSQTVAGSLM